MFTGQAPRVSAKWRRITLSVSTIVLTLGLAACGGGGGGGAPPPPQPTPAAGIGPAGGTVTGSNGATIQVPAGALAQTVNLQITEVAAGAANLPAGVQPASAIYALTPHGTTFAVPVTVTVPFNAAQVGAGRTVQALKTTNVARTDWRVQSGISVSGSNASVAVSAFSDFVLAGMGPPTITTQPSTQSVVAGQSVTFSVVAAANGGPWLTYQWQRNGVVIAGATGASYTLASATVGDDGARFSVVVGNDLAEATSAEAVLSVAAAPPAGLNLSGRWNNDYRCLSSTGSEETGSEIITVVQTGTDVSLSSGEFTGTGTLAGDVMTYTGSGPGYTEQGTWTRDGSDDRFAKQSSYTNSPAIGGSGTCTGTLTRLPPSVATAVAAGGNHTLAIRDDGTLWAWGWNRDGELGIGADALDQRVLVPTQVGMANDWRAISASLGFTLALRTDGTLWGWGRNLEGQLGDGTTTRRTSPIRIGVVDSWRSVATGGNHAVALRNDGTLWAWGFNGSGQLGDGTTDQRLVPTQIGTDTDWAAVAAGAAHTVALKTDGSLWAWGNNANGQLGDGGTTERLAPTRIGVASDWSHIAAGIRYTLAVRSDGSLWAWGENDTGQLGDGTLTTRLAPTRVGADNDWDRVAAGRWKTSMAQRTDGSLWGWGEGYSGQLGSGSSGTGANSSVPIRIGATSTWTAVAVGTWHVLGIQPGGSLWGWGYNLSGELGDGTRVDKLVPARLPF